MPSEGHPASPGNPFVPTATPVIPDHELLRLIGHGAYGEVWLACNAIGTLRAVKIVHRQSFERSEHFEREFKGLLKFEPISRSHKGMVHVLQIGRRDDAGYFFYVMELADAAKPRSEDGGLRMEDSDGKQPLPGHLPSSIFDPRHYTPHTLRSDLDKGSLPPAKCIAIGLKLASALEHLHANGLVHRDIKPSNTIFVKGEPKLADIGLVTAINEAQSLVGTAGYIPPEGPGTAQADLYSLGKVLYEIAFGKDRQEFPQLPPDLQSHPDYTALLELNEVILKACETDPRQRYQSAEAIRGDLELLGVGKSVRQKRTRQRRWTVARRMLVSAAVFAVVAASGTILWQQSRVTRPLSANPQAEELYREAVYEAHSDTVDRRLQAYTNLVEAIKLDPGFVDAYYAMFEVYFDTYVGSKLPPHYDQEANFRDVLQNLRKVSPHSAQYHTANAMVEFWDDWHFDEAISQAALAIKIDPTFMRAHSEYGFFVCLTQGDTKTALRELQKAEQIDPNDQYSRIFKAVIFSMERRPDLVVKEFLHLLELEPRTTQLYLNLGDAYVSDGQYEKALDAYKQFDLLNGRNLAQTEAWHQKLQTALREKGGRGLWQAELDAATSNDIGAYRMAVLNARLGNTDAVFPLMEQAFKEHDDGMLFILTDDGFDSLHSDPRFWQFVKKMGFHPIPGAIR